MKTNWPDNRIDHAIEIRNPLRDEVAAGWEHSPEADALFAALLHSIEAREARSEARAHIPDIARGWKNTGPARRFVFLGSGITAVGLLVAALLPIGTKPGLQNQPRTTSVSEVLRHAALVADDQPALPPLMPTGFVYTDEIDVYLASGGGGVPNNDPSLSPSPVFTALQKITRQTWLSPDGANRIVEQLINRSWLTPQDEQAWTANGAPPLDSEFPLVDGASPPSPQAAKDFVDPSKLPTDPTQLAKDLHIGTVDEIGLDPMRTTPTVIPDPTIFANVTQILAETNTPPAVRSAIYQVVSTLRGVQLLGTVQDGVGRTGTAVAFTAYGERQEMIFDPNTSQLLEAEVILTDPGLVTNDPDKNPQANRAGLNVPPGTVVQSETYLARGITTTDTEVPVVSSVPGPSGTTGDAATGAVGGSASS